MTHAPRLALVLVLLAGCSRQAAEPETSEAAPAEPALGAGIRYDQPFHEVVTDLVGDDQLPPVNQTVAGRSTALLREAVERAWPTIALAGPDGKPLPWIVTLNTETGPIEITLRPDLAPNHVRNLLALVRVGYYDGLRFDRVVRHEAEAADGQRSQVHLVRFGCPAGTGDPGVGHLGYRLRAEFSAEKHAVGTVGFTRDADPDSAGVRLYITFGPAPALDGHYTVVGKVTAGLDVVERIAAGQLLPSDADPTGELPERPVIIRKATARGGP
jgi:peptidylprolyl isomerase